MFCKSEEMIPCCFWISSGPPAGRVWVVDKEETIGLKIENTRGYHPFGHSEISENEWECKVGSLYNTVCILCRDYLCVP